LLLATREAVGELGSFIREADPGEHFLGPLLGKATLQPEDAPWAERDVVEHVQVREKVECLEHHPCVPPHEVLVDPLVSQIVAEQLDRP
jgi:hypothetical protein